MGYFGDLYYAEKERPFIGLPIEDIKATNKLLSERYASNRDQYDYLEMMEENLNTLNEKDAAWVKQRIDKTRNGIKNFTERGDWWNAGGTVKGLYKDYATDKGVQLTQANYAKYQEYEKWLDEEGDKLGWSEEDRAIASTAALRNYKGVSFIGEDGSEIEYSEQTKDKGRFAGAFNGRLLGENLSLDKYVWDAIGAKYGEPDITPQSTYYDNQQGYFVMVKGSKTFISEQEVANTTKRLMETDPKVKRWFDDVAYLQSSSPIYAAKSFETAVTNSIIDDLKKETYKGRTTEEKQAEFNKRFEDRRADAYRTIGLDGDEVTAFYNKIKSNEQLTEDDQKVLYQMINANKSLTEQGVMKNAASRYGYTQITKEYDLKNNEIWQFKEKHALEQAWSYNPGIGKGAEELVPAWNVKKVATEYGKLLAEQTRLKGELSKAGTQGERNAIQQQISENETKLVNGKRNLLEYYKHGRDEDFLKEVAYTPSYGTLIGKVLNGTKPNSMTSDDRRKLVDYINMLNEADAIVTNTSWSGKPSYKKYGYYDKIDEADLAKVMSRVSSSGLQFDKNANTRNIVNAATGVILKLRHTQDAGKIYDSYKTDVISMGMEYTAKMGKGSAFSDYMASVEDYYNNESDRLVNFTVFTSADKDQLGAAKSPLYDDYIKGVTQMFARGDQFSTLTGGSVQEWMGSMKGQAKKKITKDGAELWIDASLSATKAKLDVCKEAWDGKLYYRASFTDDEGNPLYEMDNNGKPRPIIKYVSAGNNEASRQMSAKLGKMLLQSGIESGNPEFIQQGISAIGNANFCDLTNFHVDQVPEGTKDIVPWKNLGGELQHIGIEKVGKTINTYRTKVVGNHREIDFQDPWLVNDNGTETNNFSSIQDLIMKATTQVYNPYNK